MSFYSENFVFNNISNKDMGVYLISMNDDVLMDYGIKYKDNIQKDTSKNNSFYYSESSDIEPITIALTLANEYNVPQVWSMKERKKVIDWMVTDNFCPFYSEDDPSIFYYLKCIEYNKKFNSQGHGYIEFVMQPESQYASTPIIEQVFKVNGNKEISINNIDNVNKKNYPIIEFMQLSNDNEDISICNVSTNNDPLIIKNIDKYEKLKIDNKLKSIYSNKNEYRLKDINRKWLYLKRGVNSIKINGNCEVKIITQYQLKV